MKEVLLKAVVQDIPTFAMGCFKLLLGLCRDIEKKILVGTTWGAKQDPLENLANTM